MKVRIRWGVMSILMALGAFSEVRADWMLISDSGSKPIRKAIFADIESMVDPSQSLKEGNAVFRGDKDELARLEEQRRRFKSLRFVEIFEDPKGPESRYWSVEMDGDQKSVRVLDAREFNRDASFQSLPATDWQPLSSRPWGDLAYRFAYQQGPWRTALQKLQDRVKRDGTVSEQTELESLGYQVIRNETDSGFPDLLWKYVWTDGSRPPANDSDLVIAKIDYGMELSSREDVARQKVLDDVSAQVEGRRQEQAARQQAAMPDNSALGSWLGASESDLVAKWGEPNIFNERSGSRYLTYRKERVVDIFSQGAPNSGIAITKVGEEVYWSEVTFTVVNGLVDQYETDGNEPW